jgi:hypothetical protein
LLLRYDHLTLSYNVDRTAPGYVKASSDPGAVQTSDPGGFVESGVFADAP